MTTEDLTNIQKQLESMYFTVEALKSTKGGVHNPLKDSHQHCDPDADKKRPSNHSFLRIKFLRSLRSVSSLACPALRSVI